MLTAEELRAVLVEAREELRAALERDRQATGYARRAIGMVQGAAYARDGEDQMRMIAAAQTFLEATRLLLWGSETVKAREVS